MDKHKPKVLVVDDEQVIADTLTTIFNQHGCDASAAYTGTQAIEQAKVLRPDCIIVATLYASTISPAPNGIEAAFRIREFLPESRILLWQPATMDLLESESLQEHDFELVAKPVHPEYLLHWCRADGRHNIRSCGWCHQQRVILGQAYPHGNLGNDCSCSWCLGLSTPEELEQRANAKRLEATKRAERKAQVDPEAIPSMQHETRATGQIWHSRFNRLFLLIALAWAVFVLVIFPIQQRIRVTEHYGTDLVAIQHAREWDWQHGTPVTTDGSIQALQKLADSERQYGFDFLSRLGLSLWGGAGTGLHAVWFASAAIAIPLVITYFFLRAIGAIGWWAWNGFRAKNRLSSL